MVGQIDCGKSARRGFLALELLVLRVGQLRFAWSLPEWVVATSLCQSAQASLTDPTGCPGFEFSGLRRTIRRRARHRVTICRGFRHSLQIVESEDVVTDRRQKVFGAATARLARSFLTRDTPACPAKIAPKIAARACGSEGRARSHHPQIKRRWRRLLSA
jgi:hypothetical protein